MGLGSEKVVRLIEESGGDVVCFENCGEYKKVQPVEENQDPFLAIAKRYLSIPCSVMSPNDGRFFNPVQTSPEGRCFWLKNRL